MSIILYTFHRAEGFYPLELPDTENIITHATLNPGTLSVWNHCRDEQVFDSSEQLNCSDAWEQGSNAFEAGWQPEDNPHPKCSKPWHEWDAGWVAQGGEYRRKSPAGSLN